MIYLKIGEWIVSAEFQSVNVYQSSPQYAQEVPIDTIEATINTSADLKQDFEARTPLMAYWDSARTNLIGVFYVSDYDHWRNKEWRITAVSKIGLISDETFPDTVYLPADSRSAKSICDEIFGQNEFGQDEISFSPANLGDTPLSGYIPAGTKRTALQAIAFALGARVTTAGRSNILITTVNEAAHTLTAENIYDSGIRIEKTKHVTAVKVAYYTVEEIQVLYQNFYDNVIQIGEHYYAITHAGDETAEDVTDDPENEVYVENQYLIGSGLNAQAIATALLAYYRYTYNIAVKTFEKDIKPGAAIGLSNILIEPLTGVVNGIKYRIGRSDNVAELEVKMRSTEGYYTITVLQMSDETVIGSFSFSAVADYPYYMELPGVIYDGSIYNPVNSYVSGTATQDVTIPEQYTRYVGRPTIEIAPGILGGYLEEVRVISQAVEAHSTKWYVDNTLLDELYITDKLLLANYDSEMPARSTPYSITAKTRALSDSAESVFSNTVFVTKVAVEYLLEAGVSLIGGRSTVMAQTMQSFYFTGADGKAATVAVDGVTLESGFTWQTSAMQSLLIIYPTAITGNVSITIGTGIDIYAALLADHWGDGATHDDRPGEEIYAELLAAEWGE